MAYTTRQNSLYEVHGRTRDDGRTYLVHLCSRCGDYVVYLPDAECTNCGRIEAAEVVKAPQGHVEEAQERIRNKKCICVDFLNGNPDPVPNPDCPIHGVLDGSDTSLSAQLTDAGFGEGGVF